MNLMMLLEMASAGYADRTAVTDGQTSLSYSELFATAGAAARRVQESGAKHLAVLDVSSPVVPAALFASAWAGVPFVPLNYRLTDAELERLTSQIAPALLITDSERAPQLQGLDGIEVVAREDFLDQVKSVESLEASSWPMDAEDIAILLFTSGTTGPPKAAVIRHKHLTSYILTTVEFGIAGEDDSQLVSVPPYHIAGMATVCSSIYAGRRLVQLPNFSAKDWLELARDHEVTNAFVVPTMLSRIIDELEVDGEGTQAELPSLRALAYGGGKMPLPVIEKAMAAFPNADFTQAYGLTETSSTIAVLGPEDHRGSVESDDTAVRKRLTSVGRPIPSVEVEIRDEEGNPVAAGGRGEIYVRGEQVSGEYLGRGSSVLSDGYFPTRDGGYLDSEGYLFLEGRQDDIIVRGGENMSPGEIEDVLILHEAVRDVAVVGIPSEQWGEAVAAAVVLHRGKDASVEELKAFVKAELRSSRTPEKLVFRDELPYNETGKLLRRLVREDLGGAPS
ncbi:MAG: class I adenylate-forming enzyme family protein [Myxococcota bacterium]|nr:class I adenylate-forming enzyme family protein [Myxococcota bacterium]